MAQGKLITVEGVEGVGKSTNIQFVADYLQNKGKDVVVTREPGGTALGEKVRGVLLDTENTGMGAKAELLLMFAARVEHVEQVVQPALAKGQWVVSDRFTDASFAYQGGGRGLPSEMIARLVELTLSGLKPDLTFILDMDVGIGLERAGKRSTPDRFEQEQHSFFEKVRAGYLNIARQEPGRCKVIQASESIKGVQAQLIKPLDALFSHDAS